MAPRLRRHITDSEKTQLWERWQQGESLHQIARWLGRRHSSIRRVIAQAGGIRPAPKRRSPRA
ncbi:helix-turn-helix domain-containing protein [Dyella sp. ASV21]|uniref:helix-turn-helix domain-containing protein n=1 Tax=Dyella sp. ASV21 TaxID=2795114 RepID=UPI0018EDD977|nr:helix-turn-helix domain-containing protein [Dyella sp. ASV21]